MSRNQLRAQLTQLRLPCEDSIAGAQLYNRFHTCSSGSTHRHLQHLHRLQHHHRLHHWIRQRSRPQAQPSATVWRGSFGSPLPRREGSGLGYPRSKTPDSSTLRSLTTMQWSSSPEHIVPVIAAAGAKMATVVTALRHACQNIGPSILWRTASPSSGL